MASGLDEWKIWLEQHGRALALFARQWVSTRADAQDVVQEAFIRFWRSRQRVADPTAYLYACVKHCALDAQRSHRRRLKREQATARPETEPLFVGGIEQSERRRMMQASLRNLPENQREAVVMRIWGGLSFVQIGAALGTSPDTAASRYRYAMARLRAELSGE
jgi:RNA polymerase sigma-70 factor (ECF subfamily)